MKIHSIEFKNIASYGGNPQIIEFDDNNSNFYLVSGGNGAGKSTIANAILFALYGKVDGVNLSDLPNRINNSLLTKIRLTCGSKRVYIERGLKPKKFYVEIDGIEFDTAGKSNVQEYLEEEVFKIPYHVFKNIIVLSIDEFKSFINMSNKDKRNIIDRLFGFSILNDMTKVIKEDRRILKEDIKSLDDELNQLSENIISINNKLDLIENISKKEKLIKINKYKEELVKLDTDKNRIIKLRERLVEISNNIHNEIEKHKTLYNNKSEELRQAKENVDLRQQSKCPLCQSSLKTKFQLNILDKNKEKLIKIPKELDIINNKVTECNKKRNKSRLKEDELLKRVSTINSNIDNFKRELIKIAKELKENKNLENIEFNKLIEEFKLQEEDKSNKLIHKNEDDYFLGIIESILGDDGVKNLALKTILPALNTTISSLYQEMHLNFQLRFDEKFDCIVTSMGNEINAGTLSTGEKKKADFVIIIAIIKMLKLRFPQLNLLFLDEIFSSIDPDGIHSILQILNKVIKEHNINTFVINHTVLPAELFDIWISMYKENGFSKIKLETIT